MQSLDDLIDAFGGLTEFGKACGYAENHSARGSDIKRRGSIPVDRWPGLIAAAQDRNIPGVTPDFLMHLHAPTDAEAAS